MIVEILIILIIYLLLLIAGLYYFTLFKSKEQFTKEELKDVMPFFTRFFETVNSNYSLPLFFLVFIISAFFSILLVLLINSWIINSALLPAVIFLLLPYIKNHYEQYQVSLAESYADTAVNILVKYALVIVIGFCAGAGTALIYNWAVYKVIHFLWFLPNFIAISAFIAISLNKIME